MSLPLLYTQPQSPMEWKGWAFNHAALHYTVIGAIGRQKSQNLQQFIMYPINSEDPGSWLWQHQVMHNQANVALGLGGGYNLLGLDWQDPQQFEIWLQTNGDEHSKWSQMLGV